MADSDPINHCSAVLREVTRLKLAHVHFIESRADNENATNGPDSANASAVAFGRHFDSNPDLSKRLALGKPWSAYDRTTL